MHHASLKQLYLKQVYTLAALSRARPKCKAKSKVQQHSRPEAAILVVLETTDDRVEQKNKALITIKFIAKERQRKNRFM